MLTQEQARKLAGKILSYSSFPECAVTLSDSEVLNVRFANNGITTSGFTVERSITIASTREAKTGRASTDQVDDASLRAAVKRSEELADLAPANPEHMPPLGKQEYPALDRFDQETAAARSPLLVPQVRAIIEPVTKAGLVAAGYFQRTAGSQAIANKAGLFGFHRSTDANLSTTVRSRDGASSGWAGQPAIRIREIDGAALADRAIGKCRRWVKPAKLEPGKYTVLLEPAAVCNLVGLMGPFSFSARSAEEGQSFLSKKGGGTLLGEKLFPEMVTLRSDPTDARLHASPWGAQDLLPVRPLRWIDKGVVRNLYYDRYWARKAEKEPTPNNGALILEGSETSPEDLLKSVDRGLLVTRFWYIRTLNPRTLQMTGLTRDGVFLIEGGALAGAVMNFRFNESPARLLQNVMRTLTATSVMGLSSTLLLGIVGAAVMYVGARQVLAGAMTLGEFFTYTVFLGFLVGPIFQIVAIGTQITEALAGLERTREVLNERPEDTDPRRVVSLHEIRGDLEFENVSFAYDPGKPVLHEISFRAEPGTVTALVGSSGSGKSTIIGLVAAFHAPDSGTVWIDGADLSSVRLDSYRTRLGVVLQDTFLFDGTIRENVAFSRPDAPPEAILAACRAARVDEFAESFPDGYDTIVGERGVKLSGGQKQRVSIARAILADPRILILDEATSSLDSESEARIQEALGHLMRGRTTFVIAHRLSTIRRADQILVVEGGRIVERGTHETLYELGGRYLELYTRQQGLEANLFLAPGEGDGGEEAPEREGAESAASLTDALRLMRGRE